MSKEDAGLVGILFICAIACCAIGFLVGHYDGGHALASCRAAQQQAVDQALAFDREASFWKNEFDGCDTMNDAIPTLVQQIVECRVQLENGR